LCGAICIFFGHWHEEGQIKKQIFSKLLFGWSKDRKKWIPSILQAAEWKHGQFCPPGLLAKLTFMTAGFCILLL
jgi:hypothetical protein